MGDCCACGGTAGAAGPIVPVAPAWGMPGQPLWELGQRAQAFHIATLACSDSTAAPPGGLQAGAQAAHRRVMGRIYSAPAAAINGQNERHLPRWAPRLLSRPPGRLLPGRIGLGRWCGAGVYSTATALSPAGSHLRECMRRQGSSLGRMDLALRRQGTD